MRTKYLIVYKTDTFYRSPLVSNRLKQEEYRSPESKQLYILNWE